MIEEMGYCSGIENYSRHFEARKIGTPPHTLLDYFPKDFLLIIIDGGLGQLNMALRSLKHLGFKIPIIGLAKQEEEIYTPNEKEPLQFDKNSKMMLLLREIRDSAHHFVLGYNKKRREMKLREEFEEIKR
ncbi:MAG: hypothetical protein WC916_05385 [Candidatus Woesearchaeota archaeon]